MLRCLLLVWAFLGIALANGITEELTAEGGRSKTDIFIAFVIWTLIGPPLLLVAAIVTVVSLATDLLERGLARIQEMIDDVLG